MCRESQCVWFSGFNNCVCLYEKCEKVCSMEDFCVYRGCVEVR